MLEYLNFGMHNFVDPDSLFDNSDDHNVNKLNTISDGLLKKKKHTHTMWMIS